MPWCDECSKFWSPSSLPRTGACPTCGRTLHAGTIATARRERVEDDVEVEDYKAPWHFKLMIVLAALYLGWRFVQLVSWFV